MAGNLLTNGWIPPHPHTPPGFLGLKKRFRFYLERQEKKTVFVSIYLDRQEKKWPELKILSKN